MFELNLLLPGECLHVPDLNEKEDSVTNPEVFADFLTECFSFRQGSFTRPSKQQTLQATNVGVRWPGYSFIPNFSQLYEGLGSLVPRTLPDYINRVHHF